MQKITKPVTTYVDVYLADDGVEFECEYSCKQHEELVKLFHEGEPLKHGKSLWLPQNFAVDPSDDVMKPSVKDSNYYYDLSTTNQILYFLRNGWRVPKVEEWDGLLVSLGCSVVNRDSQDPRAWEYLNCERLLNFLNVKLCGHCNHYSLGLGIRDSYDDVGEKAFFQTATRIKNDRRYNYILNVSRDGSAYFELGDASTYTSVRLVKDL